MQRSLVLATFISATLTSATLPASEVPPSATTEAIVQKELIAPLAAKEKQRSKFSRAELPAEARRVRVLHKDPLPDAQGGQFVMFAIDARHGYLPAAAEDPEKGWRKDTILGCVYPEKGEVFVKRGDAYYPAALLLGKKRPVAAKHVCNTGIEIASRK